MKITTDATNAYTELNRQIFIHIRQLVDPVSRVPGTRCTEDEERRQAKTFAAHDEILTVKQSLVGGRKRSVWIYQEPQELCRTALKAGRLDV